MTYLLISAIPTNPAASSAEDAILGKPALSSFGDTREENHTTVELIEDCFDKIPCKTYNELSGKHIPYAKSTFVYRGIDTYTLKTMDDAEKLTGGFEKVLDRIDEPVGLETVLDVVEFLDLLTELLYDCEQAGETLTVTVTKLVDLVDAGIDDLPKSGE